MATARIGTADRGRQMASPRPKTRDNKDTLCRNVLIYGHCRYEEHGCTFNHDQNRGPSNPTDNHSQEESLSMTRCPEDAGSSAWAAIGAERQPSPRQSCTVIPSLGQTDFPTLMAAASISMSKRERQAKRQPIPSTFRPDISVQDAIDPSISSSQSAVIPLSRSWADITSTTPSPERQAFRSGIDDGCQGQGVDSSNRNRRVYPTESAGMYRLVLDNFPRDFSRSPNPNRRLNSSSTTSTPANLASTRQHCRSSSSSLQPKIEADSSGIATPAFTKWPVVRLPPSTPCTRTISSTGIIKDPNAGCGDVVEQSAPKDGRCPAESPTSIRRRAVSVPLAVSNTVGEQGRSYELNDSRDRSTFGRDELSQCASDMLTLPPGRRHTHSEASSSPVVSSYHTGPTGSSPSILTSSSSSDDTTFPPSAKHCEPHIPQTSNLANGLLRSNPKKMLNVDSPSFTPAQLGSKKPVFSTNAIPFTPRAVATSTNPMIQQEPSVNIFKPTQFTDFTPQNNYDLSATASTNGSADNGSMGYDPFTMSGVGQSLQSTPYNPYSEEHNPLAAAGASYYSAQNAYSTSSQPLQYHQYYPIASIRESLQPYQRQVHDLFLPESIREDLQKRSEAARQILNQPGMAIPTLQQYHSLVPLDTKIRNTSNIFGFSTWLFKATSKKNGNILCLRRIEGFRLTAEEAIKAVNLWQKIVHPNIVTTIEAFTTREFGDNSLVFVHSYHPLSKTLADVHFATARYGRPVPVSEKVLWSYLVQLNSALRAIHKAKLAARCIDISKIILTDKNRVRISTCSILDVLQFEAHRRIEDLQQEDLYNLGKLILGIATNTNPRSTTDPRVLLEQLGRTYSPELKERVVWLLSPAQNVARKTAEQLTCDIAQHVDDVLVASFNANDELINHLGKELENGRIARLMTKLGMINERPEFDGDPTWSETAERYTLKLFRDYVFHQVDSQGSPVVDIGHVISCLNKLDAGTDEKIFLTSRDNQSTFVVSYKELKKQVQSAFGELLKGSAKLNQKRGF